MPYNAEKQGEIAFEEMAEAAKMGIARVASPLEGAPRAVRDSRFRLQTEAITAHTVTSRATAGGEGPDRREDRVAPSEPPELDAHGTREKRRPSGGFAVVLRTALRYPPHGVAVRPQ